MTPGEVREELAIEAEAIEAILAELGSLHQDVGEAGPTARELAAAGLFLANFYNGIENILKRICRYRGVEMPSGEDWHVVLVTYFCDPPRHGLPLLLQGQLASDLAPYRRFRHVVHHGYGFQLRWEDMLPGIEDAPGVWSSFRAVLESYLAELDTQHS